MKLTTGIVVLAITAGTAWGQNPTVLANTKNSLQGAQKPATAQAPAVPAKPAAATAAKPVTKATAAPAKQIVPVKSAPITVKPAVAPAKAPASAKNVVAAKPAATAAKSEPAPSEGEDAKSDKQDKKWSMTGRRDPFVSPVVSRQGGSGCSTGKKCLEIAQVALRGVVRSDNGMIAVVTNGLNKAYFLRENDPVFNGYVVKITGDSIVFKETVQDKLGKPFTRDVVKKITTPAV
jgi:hypothetical protein